MSARTSSRVAVALAAAALLSAAGARAEIQYVTDKVTVQLRANPVNDGKPVGTPLDSGKPVELLQRSPDGKWARVRFQQVEGWMPANLVQKEQAAQDRLIELQARYDALSREQKTGGTQLSDLEAEVQSLRAGLAQAQSERDTALAQLGDLKMTAAGPQKLAATNQSLEEKATLLAIDNERLKSEVDRLTSDRSASYLLYGGFVVFGGIAIGWLMARQPGRRNAGW